MCVLKRRYISTSPFTNLLNKDGNLLHYSYVM